MNYDKHENMIIYKLSDLVAKNKMPSFWYFKYRIIFSIAKYWMTNETLQKLYAFIEVVQNHPRHGELAFALKNMFSMVLIDMFHNPLYFTHLSIEYPILKKLEIDVIKKYPKLKKLKIDKSILIGIKKQKKICW